jgi:hypothetical protein
MTKTDNDMASRFRASLFFQYSSFEPLISKHSVLCFDHLDERVAGPVIPSQVEESRGITTSLCQRDVSTSLDMTKTFIAL